METIKKPPRNKRAKTGNKTGDKTGEIKSAGVGVRYLEILSTGTTAHRLSPEAEVVGLAVVKRGGYDRLYICVVSPSGEEVKREFFAVRGPCPPGDIPDGAVPVGGDSKIGGGGGSCLRKTKRRGKDWWRLFLSG